MKSNSLLLLGFVGMVLIQIYIPVKMIHDSQKVIDSGIEYKFKTAPVDPTDPIRGKYITLSFNNNAIVVDDIDEWSVGETVYVLFEKDQFGYAMIMSVSKTEPTNDRGFLKTTVSHIGQTPHPELIVKYPFNRYYMEESKAYNAEVIYRQSQLDSNQVAFALVRIKSGKAVLKDVQIDGVSISQLASKL